MLLHSYFMYLDLALTFTIQMRWRVHYTHFGTKGGPHMAVSPPHLAATVVAAKIGSS